MSGSGSGEKGGGLGSGSGSGFIKVRGDDDDLDIDNPAYDFIPTEKPQPKPSSKPSPPKGSVERPTISSGDKGNCALVSVASVLVVTCLVGVSGIVNKVLMF